MSQFTAVLVDGLRLLRAKALFWVTLGISVVTALIYLSIGFDEKGMTFFFGLQSMENENLRAGSPGAEVAYLFIFTAIIVSIWLSWIAVVLALLTCAPMFPEFIAEGSAGTVLCKPISRLRLFLYKYLSGLLFALLQTAVFCVIVFFALRWRVGSWNPTVFWAVPLVVLLFSYLWSVMVLVGVKTRSVMASVLAAVALWFFCWLAALTEGFAWSAAEKGVVGFAPISESEQQAWRERYIWVSIPFAVLPKTTETINLLHRWIQVEGEDFSMAEGFSTIESGVVDEEIDESLERHSPAFIIGSSLAFELVVMGLGAWIFCRRDF